MIQQERHERILSKLSLNGRVVVNELSDEFGVTRDCIRKDLAQLEKNGDLKRVHGGAIQTRSNPRTLVVSDRLTLNVEAKKEIAKKAVDLIEDGDVIFLDISTTNIEIAKLLIERKRPLTVVTNMIDIMILLSQCPDIKTIMIGGQLGRSPDGFTGSLAISQIMKFHFDKAFVGTVGVNSQTDQVYTYDVDDGLTKESIIRNADQAYLVMESIKYQQDGNYVFATMSDFREIITE